ncbi:MAG: amidohydrolase family protein [Anaerolineae bacterium]|jgi:predicted TIM-barrel fold metal-dependent hydrolase
MRTPDVARSSALAAEFLETGRCQSCPVIDVHAHFGPFQGIYFPKASPEGMLEMMDRAGVVTSICSPHRALLDPRSGNPIIVKAAHRYPGRFLAYLSVNPNYPEILEEDIEALASRDPAVVGIKAHPGWHKYPLSGQRYAPAFRYANEHGMPLLSHTWGHSPECGPQEVRKVAEQYPNLPILMGHSCFGQFEEAIALAREFPNVYLELTAAYRVSGVIEKMVAEAGSEKVLFGSDLPWFDQHYGIGCVIFSHITDQDRRNILRDNAIRVFGLKG